MEGFFTQLKGRVLSLVSLHSSSSTGYLQMKKKENTKKKKKSISFHRLLFAPFQPSCTFPTRVSGAARSHVSVSPPRPSLPCQINNPGEPFRASHPFSLVTGLLLILFPPFFFLPRVGETAGLELKAKANLPPTARARGAPPRPPRSGFPLPEALCTQRARFCRSIR